MAIEAQWDVSAPPTVRLSSDCSTDPRLGRLLPPASRAALIFLIASTGVLAGEKEADSDTAVPATNIRREILSEFRFVPSQAAPVPHKSTLARGPTLPKSQTLAYAGADIVRMAPYTVHESLKMEELHQDILNEQADAHTADLMKKMGIGLHEAPIGKVHFFTATVFYIPIIVGVGIDW